MQFATVALLVVSTLGQSSQPLDYREVLRECPPFTVPHQVPLEVLPLLDKLLETVTDDVERDKILSHRAACYAVAAKDDSDYPLLRVRAALRDLSAIEPRYKTDFRLYETRVEVKRAAGEPRGEIHSELDVAIEKFPDASPLRKLKVYLLFEDRDFRQAERIARRLAEANAQDGESRVLLGYALFQLNDTENALVEARAGLSHSERLECPEDVAYLTIARSLLELGQTDEALASARLAIKTANHVPDQHWLAIWACYANMGRPFSALAQASAAMTERPTHGPMLALRGLSEVNCGRPELGLKYAQAGLKLHPDSFLVRWALGRTLATNGSYGLAVESLEAAELTSDHASFTRESWDCRLRLALLRCSADDSAARDGKQAIKLCLQLEAQTMAKENQRLAELVRACGHAETGDYTAALKLLRSLKPLSEADRDRIERLDALFKAERPHRISRTDEGVIQIPVCGFISGPLKPLRQQ